VFLAAVRYQLPTAIEGRETTDFLAERAYTLIVGDLFSPQTSVSSSTAGHRGQTSREPADIPGWSAAAEDLSGWRGVLG
jgi:hypothetical protein